VRQTINIKDSSAPKSYNFPMELQAGQRIIVNKDGSANVVNSNNESITTMLKPWARDSSNKELSTYYTIDNNILRQHITTDNMTKYPVKADPTWCGKLINFSEWIDRPSEGGKSLSIDPTWCGRNYDGEEGFKEILWRATWNDEWQWGDRNSNNQTYRYKVMRQQYLCHYHFATFKPRWNIEPWRPLVSWRILTTYNAPYICNVRWNQV
jgi:hypothetical protein